MCLWYTRSLPVTSAAHRDRGVPSQEADAMLHSPETQKLVPGRFVPSDRGIAGVHNPADIPGDLHTLIISVGPNVSVIAILLLQDSQSKGVHLSLKEPPAR